MASLTPSSVATRGILGAMPEVESVIFLLDMAMPSPSDRILSALMVFSGLCSGSPIPITTMLERKRVSFVGLGHSPYASLATINWETISPAVRFRVIFWLPVWQNLQPTAQPTCVEIHTAPRSSSGI